MALALGKATSGTSGGQLFPAVLRGLEMLYGPLLRTMLTVPVAIFWNGFAGHFPTFFHTFPRTFSTPVTLLVLACCFPLASSAFCHVFIKRLVAQTSSISSLNFFARVA